MNRKRRGALYYFLIFLFLIAGAYLIMATKGLVIDWNKFKIVKTGGIYLKIYPSEANIEINEEKYEMETNNFIKKGVFIKNLLPKVYKIKITKPDYYAWKKNFEVEEGIVSKASFITLWKKNYDFTTTTKKSVSDFWVTNEGILYKTKEKNLYLGENIIKGNDLIDFNINKSVIITKNSNGSYFFLNLKDVKSSINVSEVFNLLFEEKWEKLKKEKIKFVFLHPFSEQKIIIASDSSVFLTDLKKMEIEYLFPISKGTKFYMTDSEIIAFENKNTIKTANFLLNSTSSFEFPTSSINSIKTNKSGNLFFILEEDGKLEIWEKGKENKIKISDEVKNFFVSADEKRIFITLKNSNIKIYQIEEESGDIKVKKGTIMTLQIEHELLAKNAEITEFAPEINSVFIQSLDKIIVSEIDNRVPLNAQEIFSNVRKFKKIEDEVIILKIDGALGFINLKQN